MLVFFRVHILADVTSLSVSPSSAGLNVLDDHCMPDRDRIPHESIHYLLPICKSFLVRLLICMHFSIFFMYILHTKRSFYVDR